MPKWSCSWSIPLLTVAIIVAVLPAAAKPRDLSLFPLRVHIFESQWQPSALGGSGSGRANLFNGDDIRGFDFSYFCPINYMKSIDNQAYAARWKKQDKKIEIVGNKVGNEDKSDTCEFNVTMHDFVYDLQNGTLATFTQEQYKVRSGRALPNAAPVDADPSHYPIRIAVLDISWTSPTSGSPSATGRGNLHTATGASSVDFSTSCNARFPANSEGHLYAGKWMQENSTLAILLVASDKKLVCTLNTSVHTDVYVRNSVGKVTAVSAEEYRRTLMAQTAPPAASQPASIPSSTAATIQPTPSDGNVARNANSSKTTPTAATETEETPLGRKQSTPIVVTETSQKPVAGPGAAQGAIFYRKGCDAGFALSCRNLAIMYGNGTGVAQDYGHAAGLYRKACNGGDPVSCANLGLMYANGTGIAQDFVQASTLYRKACDGNIGMACSNLALLYSNGTGVSQDYTQAVTLYNKACAQGVQAGCGNLGLMYANGTGVSRNYDRAVSLYSKACDAGNMVSCANLGSMYGRGTGVPQDNVRAAALYRRGCDSGLSVGCYNLGTVLVSGVGVERDYALAATLFQKGCDDHIADSCINLGNLFDRGNGVSQDHTQAMSLYRKACDGGSAAGCNNLGVAYEKQTSVAPAPK